MLNWMSPTNVSEIRSFLRLAGYYRGFIQDFLKITKPMTRLLKKGKDFEWTKDCQASFEELLHCSISFDSTGHNEEVRYLLRRFTPRIRMCINIVWTSGLICIPTVEKA
jgi:hypothetical protein